MLFRDIGLILNKTSEDKNTERLKEQKEDNINSEKNQEQQQLSLSTQAYKLFSDKKTPLEVAIALNLRESEATKFYKEHWKLKQLHNLNMVYEETKGDIAPFLKLYIGYLKPKVWIYRKQLTFLQLLTTIYQLLKSDLKG
jgi:hypothetical protein